LSTPKTAKGTKRVRIRASQRVHYNQVVIMSAEDFKRLRRYEKAKDWKALDGLLEEYLDLGDIHDGDPFDDGDIEYELEKGGAK
jgi:hypothetical protein